MFASFRAEVAAARRHGDLFFAALLSQDVILTALGVASSLWQGWIYTPEVTIWVFLSQCLSADHSCRDAAAWRVGGIDRRELLRTARRFDVIVSDLFVPWESRTGYLYTVEFYETVRRKLKRGGLFCQWLALYQLGPEQFEIIADSFSSVFPHTTIWWGRYDAKFAIVALVGSEEPLEIDAQQLERRLSDS